MKKIGRSGIAIFLVTFIISLLVTAPATLLSRVVEATTSGRVVLANARGSFWQGKATPAIRKQSGNLLALEQLHWDIEIIPLLTGKIITRLSWEDIGQSQPMVVAFSYSQVEFRNVIIPLPAAVLGEMYPLLQPAQLSGQVLIKSDLLGYANNEINGNAIADWSNAGSVFSAVNPLGSYRLNITGKGGQLEASLMTLSGSLILEGSGNYAGSQGFKFQWTARATEESKESLKELLNNFGPETSAGVHTLNLMK